MIKPEMSMGKEGKKLMEHISQLLDQSRQIGRYEVANFVEKEFGYFTDEGLAKIIVDDGGYYGREGSIAKWQAQLKKWGLSE